MPSPPNSIRSEEPGRRPRPLVPEAWILLAAFFLTAIACLPAPAQESSRNVIRWQNDKGDEQQLDVGPSLPRRPAASKDESDREMLEKERQDEERRRLEAEREKLELKREIAELEREIAAIDRQIKDMRSRQERLEHDARYGSDLEYYLGWQISRQADKRRKLRLYRDRFRRQHERFRSNRPAPEPAPHRVQKKMQ